jgi:hypothetical protein
VLRHENLEADLRTFLNTRGVSQLPHLPKVKTGLLSDQLNPHQFFAQDQLRRINDVFGDEFDAFGYSRIL